MTRVRKKSFSIKENNAYSRVWALTEIMVAVAAEILKFQVKGFLL